ncbi:MAG: tRNA uracil 4-sulfurtransferase ThiI [Candidatus Micrarchaeaceae archaeon]
MEEVLVAKFGELWLRGRNRGSFIRILLRNISLALAGESYRLDNKYDRLVIHADANSLERIKGKLKNIFGLSICYIATTTEPKLDKIEELAEDYIAKMKASGSKAMKINAHRSYKELPFDSIKIMRSVAKIAARHGIDVSNNVYDSQIFINVSKDAAYIYTSIEECARGLPVGSSGKGVVLFSGGIDSPVAAWYAMKRGIAPVYLHVHAFKSADEIAATKVPRLLEMLAKYSSAKVYYIPGYIFQVAAMKASRSYEAVLFKAFLFRLAAKIAKREGASAIITGESLGQVASQTVANIHASELGIKMPILRPLIGFDKEEIIAAARRIGTYEESIKPYKDVCSIGVRKPTTAADAQVTRNMLKEIGIAKVVNASLRKAKVAELQRFKTL